MTDRQRKTTPVGLWNPINEGLTVPDRPVSARAWNRITLHSDPRGWPSLSRSFQKAGLFQQSKRENGR
jgi:hypothetical protein